MGSANIPRLNKRIFWIVNFDAIDYENPAPFVIQRVFERGDVCDIRQCRRYYGHSKISAVLTRGKGLPLNAIYLLFTTIRPTQ